MSSKICAKCGKANSPEMSFCSNCGTPLGSSAPNTSKYTEDPPPTVFMGQSPPKPSDSPFGQSGGSGQSNKPNNPFDSPNTPNTPFGQPQQQSNNPFGQTPPPNNPFGQGQQNTPPFTPNVQTPQFTPTPASPPQPPKKSNKGLIFGVVGCLGLLVISVIGIGIVGFAFSDDLFGKKNNYPTPTPNLGNSSSPITKNSPKGSTTPFDNKNSSPTTDDSDSSALLLSILESRKEVGKYTQTDAKTVTVSDYFPKGNGAAQATYSGGGKYVFLTVAKFDTNEDAKQNFNDQVSGVKSNGGKVTYQNTASDGTISAIYEKGGYYFAEYCNTNNYCNRIHSNNRDALRDFFKSYADVK
ncbi:MAG TPA: zinc-ribbon domain-containing protein [Pyrinomonadaceae bacterium]|nr:zinc-ribbon domain-containing protein [Pyrinomonadaceae bacterium]